MTITSFGIQIISKYKDGISAAETIEQLVSLVNFERERAVREALSHVPVGMRDGMSHYAGESQRIAIVVCANIIRKMFPSSNAR